MKLYKKINNGDYIRSEIPLRLRMSSSIIAYLQQNKVEYDLHIFACKIHINSENVSYYIHTYKDDYYIVYKYLNKGFYTQDIWLCDQMDGVFEFISDNIIKKA